MQKERSSIIISIPRTLQDNVQINDETKSYNWYDTHISFKSYENDDMNILPMNLINNGSYISHWKKGDKICLKDSTKKLVIYLLTTKYQILINCIIP